MSTHQTPEIVLSNRHRFSFMVASGALAFDGRGWPWERFLVNLGLIDTRLFTIVAKSITKDPRPGNLSWWHPWTCVWPIAKGWVNKVGLTNPGMDWWYRAVGSKVDRRSINLMGSAFGNKAELLAMIPMFNKCDLVGVEINFSCPNAKPGAQSIPDIVDAVEAVCNVSEHPIIFKASVNMPYLELLAEFQHRGLPVEAVSLNSVPWEMAFPEHRSPLHRLEQRVGGGGGGVSGKAAQAKNWEAVSAIVHQPGNKIPVIGPSVWNYFDIPELFDMGAKAVSFGSIHIGRPTVPTNYVKVWNSRFDENNTHQEIIEY
ncbi:MAG: hypothetical protein RL094_696 [Candidatus Parcubacteria bacterium]|jgi:dihydroorotate dehydrogenase